MSDGDPRTKALAALGLVCVSSTVGILYKISQATSGGFKYSTTSAIAIAEMVKFGMSTFFHIGDASHHTDSEGKVPSAIGVLRSQLSMSAIGHIWCLAGLYTMNNQLSFYVYMLADPGTIFLFKAASTMIVASIQCFCLGKQFSGEQWKAMGLQAVGMVIVQYNPCKSEARYNPAAYLLMSLSAVLTALCAVRNEYLVKNYKIGLNVQNMVLYSGGIWMNIFAFMFLPNPNSTQAGLGFFDGFNNPLAIGVVFANAMIGLAITAVYKYADAVTKCIASDVTAVVLCIVSTFFFELASSVTMWCGVLVVCFAVHFYTSASMPAPPAPAQPPKARELDLKQATEASITGEGGSEGSVVDTPEQEEAQLLGKPTK
mmetsp:Transcript_47715/g.152384  ORF Transcript_47715/g.152384 Transcript_47715/m.152384 type:complete len:372 (-) Transcript_47715:89-1204(-)